MEEIICGVCNTIIEDCDLEDNDFLIIENNEGKEKYIHIECIE